VANNKAMQGLVDMSPEELAQQEQELREELFQTRFKNQMRQLDNPIKIRDLRRQIARVRTLITTPAKPAAKAAAHAQAKAEKAAKPEKAAKAAKTPKTKAAKATAKEKTR
jgi:large subunit ribosomal protein L29